MPRIARKDLNTNFVHVMVQGINKEFIFNDEIKIRKYLNLVKKNIQEDKFVLLAYCMMNNHAHFLFWVNDFSAFGKYMQKNNLIFSQSYNLKNNRCGVVFRNRYQSEPIYTLEYLKNCIKYIHANPVKAGMVRSCKDYKYSSYREYANNSGVANNPILKELFGNDCDILKLCDETFERKFIDIDRDDEKNDVYIKAGISEFMKKTNCNLAQILSEKSILKELFIFLKTECNIKYKDFRDFLDMSVGSSNYILNK